LKLRVDRTVKKRKRNLRNASTEKSTVGRTFPMRNWIRGGHGLREVFSKKKNLAHMGGGKKPPGESTRKDQSCVPSGSRTDKFGQVRKGGGVYEKNKTRSEKNHQRRGSA